MFLPFFLVFTLIFTLFENIVIAGSFFFFIVLILLVYQSISKKKVCTKKTIGAIVLAFVLVMLAFGVKEWRYYDMGRKDGIGGQDGFDGIDGIGGVESNPSNLSNSLQSNLVVGTGMVMDISSQGKYVFRYQNNDYLLYSSKEYHIGDQLRIVGRKQNNNREDGFSYRNVTSSTFAVPLFSGSFDFAKWMKMKGRRGNIYEDNSILIDGTDGIDGIGGVESNPSNPSNLSKLIDGVDRIDGIEEKDRLDGIEEKDRLDGIDRLGAFESNPSNPSNPSNSPHPSHLVKQLKRSIQEKVVEVYGKNRISGLILGMLIGDKSLIPQSEYQSFINSGLVHLVAVSGGNILMIVVFLHFILFFLPFYIRIGVILLTIVGYGFICGLDSSVFRAVLMGGMNMVAIFRGREINIWRLLSISCIFMLLINPYFLVYDTGFLLSYSALMGIIWFDSRVRENDGIEGKDRLDGFPIKSGMTERGNAGIEGKDGIGTRNKEQVPRSNSCVQKGLLYIYKNYMAPSIGASIGIFPIILFFMGKINVLGILGNLLVLPIVPFVMIYGFVSVWLYSLLGWGRLLWIEKIGIQYIYKISDLLSQYGLYFLISGLRCKYVVLLGFVVGFVLWRLKKSGDIESGELKSGKLGGSEVRYRGTKSEELTGIDRVF